MGLGRGDSDASTSKGDTESSVNRAQSSKLLLAEAVCHLSHPELPQRLILCVSKTGDSLWPYMDLVDMDSQP